MRDRLVLTGAAVAVALAAFVAVTPWLTPWPFDGEAQDAVQRAGFAAVAAVGALVALRRTTAARLAGWFAVPALLLGWGMWGSLWVPPGPRWSAAGGPMTSVPATVALDATRLTALVLVLVVGGLVLGSRRPVPARAAAYLVPALLLSWVWWHTSAGGSYGVAGSSTWLEPSLADRLPWIVTSVAETALVVVLWVLAVRGWHELLRRYRPPDAGLVSPTAR